MERVGSAGDNDQILSQGKFEAPCGAINQRGQTVIPFRYKSLGSFNKFGLAIAEDASGRFGCVDRHGDVVIPFKWRRIHEFDSNGRAWASRVSETSSIDTSGRVIETYPFAFVPPFNRHGLARSFEPQLRWRLINRAGEFVSPLEWDYIEPFDNEGFAVVHLATNNGKTKRYGVINESGQWQVEPIWLEIIQQRQMHSTAVKWSDVHSTVFDSRGWCLVKAESGFGWIDKNGLIVSPLMWMSASRFIQFDDGMDSPARVTDESGTGYIDRRGNIVIPLTFAHAGVFDTGGLAPAAVGAKDHLKWGWINRSGEFHINPEWDEVERFAPNGLALVCRNGRWGCIDRTGEIRVEPRWYSVSVWNDWYNQPWRNDGIHVVSYNPDEWLILNRNGREIRNLGVPPKCWSYGFNPAECEIATFGFHRFFYEQSEAGRSLHRTATKLPASVGRIASKITEPLNHWSLEYEMLDNSGATIWSSVQSHDRHRRTLLFGFAGGICMVLSYCQTWFGLKLRHVLGRCLRRF